MARNTAVHVLDDLNGEPAEETVSFALDGVEYDIDLSAENAANLRGILDAYVGNGRRTGGRKRRPRTFAVPKRGRRAAAGAKTAATPKKTAKAAGGTTKAAPKKVSPKTSATAKAAAAKVKPAKASAKAAPKTAAKAATEKKTATARKPAAAKTSSPAKPKRSTRKAPPVLFSAAE
ncbi:Lsr2 dimerization domain-containing protein [Amycolatopsis sp. CA-230715]|uniref:Lsr2 dimerization domain-containing protein n=1 Tax=Amycolatopsis sp. CA-230715 TaxID=2745196 RepID=UPI001C01B316|nr:histone-like nucleoid-structuring protein Lsr2 [Amycolatopsis sp. CA-230715]QWF83087.1 hypothetical protein HUW46_06526 [Amycolatopsis sp. CA-230715]